MQTVGFTLIGLAFIAFGIYTLAAGSFLDYFRGTVRREQAPLRFWLSSLGSIVVGIYLIAYIQMHM